MLMKCIVAPGDTERAIISKRVMFVTYALGFSAGMWTVIDAGDIFTKTFAALGVAAAILGVAQIIWTKRLSYLMAEVFIGFSGLIIIQNDLGRVVNLHTRLWPWFVILIDICLVVRLRTRVSRTLIFMCVTWLYLLAFENWLHFGLYDLSYLPSKEERQKAFACDKYPCKLSLYEALDDATIAATVFLIDFYITRSFAHGLHREHQKMEAAITATERIASALSRFDLIQAEAILSTASLPAPLDTAFHNILRNLEVYRPYLPDALFHHMHSGRHRASKDIPPPGTTTGHVATVFTDIQGSTATWEACPEGMSEALKVHDLMMRDCLAEHSGYEVKTIGDSFMVAFETAMQAVQFGLAVQETLVYAPWPAELLALDQYSWSDDGPWCGLRVRVGVHCGEVEVQLNPLTGRYDYFGNTVNKAARMEGACVGGAVAVTHEVLAEAGDLDDVCVIDMGTIELKGVQGGVSAYMLLPEGLAGRREFVLGQMKLKREDRLLMLAPDDEGSSQSTLGTRSHTSMLVTPDMALSFRVNASVGMVKVVLRNFETDRVTDDVNSALGKVMACTERSHGTIVSLQGSRVAVCWNGPKPCATHVENSLAFVQMIGSGRDGEQEMHVGVATGGIVYGAVGGRRQRFMAVLGECMGVAGRLCSDAVADNVLCYYGSPVIPSALASLTLASTEKGSFNTPSGTVIRMLHLQLSRDVEADQVTQYQAYKHGSQYAYQTLT